MANGSGNVSNVINYTGVTGQNQTAGVTQGATVVPGVVGTAAANFISLGGQITSSTANFYYFLQSNSGGQYQVPAGKTFYITDIYVQSNTANSQINFGSGTAALGANGTVTAPTGSSVLLNSGITSGAFVNSPTINTWQHYSFPGLSFAASSYPYWNTVTATQSHNVMVFGIVQ